MLEREGGREGRKKRKTIVLWKENSKSVKIPISLSPSLITSSPWKSLLSSVPPNLSVSSPLSLSFSETLSYSESAFSTLFLSYIIFLAASNLLSLCGWSPELHLWPRLLSQVSFVVQLPLDISIWKSSCV